MPNAKTPDGTDHHTEYLIRITYHSDSRSHASWSINSRYSQLKELCGKLRTAIPTMDWIREDFPPSGMMGGWLGISDETRNERMRKFDLWLRKLLDNALVMSHFVASSELIQFLEVAKHVPSPN